MLSDFSPLGALQAAQVTNRFLNRRLINCEHERVAWPDTLYLVRTTYCEQFIQDYQAEPAPLGWVISK